MSKLLKSALWYQKQGYSVIPVKRDKKPYIKWEKYQSERANQDQIRTWWEKWPGANIGLVTGKVSGIDVVDCDSEKGRDALNEFLSDSIVLPISKTPKGWHYFFSHKEGLSNGVRVITDCDLRTEGGYIIVPPSKNGAGKSYAWMQGLSIADIKPAAMPEMLFDILQSGGAGLADSSPQYKNGINPYKENVVTRGVNIVDKSTTVNIGQQSQHLFSEGSRDESLFHLANCLVRGGMNEDNLFKYLSFFASHCDPPFPKKEIPIKIQSALKRSETRSKNLTQEIREWISSTLGNFSSTDVNNIALPSTKSTLPAERRKVSAILSRFVKSGFIERVGNQNGVFRRVEVDAEEMNFLDAETETVNIWLPFGLSEKVEIMPGNIIVIAGSPDSGKTGLLLNIIRENMRRHEVHYFNSEMGSSELKKRLSNFDDLTLDMWNFKAWERSDNFGDVIKPGPGKINIIDFLEMHENFYEVGGKLAEIHKKLKGAIAFVALQKNPGQKMGLGGFRSAEKPRLYLSMDSGALTIAKAKNWTTSENPNGLQYRFKIVGGCKFIKVQGWHRPV